MSDKVSAEYIKKAMSDACSGRRDWIVADLLNICDTALVLYDERDELNCDCIKFVAGADAMEEEIKTLKAEVERLKDINKKLEAYATLWCLTHGCDVPQDGKGE